jgi:hypothetical protein
VVYPDTDYLASFAPLSPLPTQYRVSVEGQGDGWYAQCGFEALAVCWLFPGKTVRVEAPCLDCNEPLGLEMRDGTVLSADPPGLIGHLNLPWNPAREGRPFR